MAPVADPEKAQKKLKEIISHIDSSMNALSIKIAQLRHVGMKSINDEEVLDHFKKSKEAFLKELEDIKKNKK